MAPSSDNDDSQSSSDSGVDLGGRLRNPGVGTTEFEAPEDEAVDKIGDRMRETRQTEDDDGPDDSSIDEQDVEDDEFEDVVLDALDSEAKEPAPERPGQRPDRDTDAGVGNPDMELEGPNPSAKQTAPSQPGKKSAQETDTGTGTAVDESDAPTGPQADGGDSETAGQECPSCDSVSPPGMRFCVQCGESLQTDESETTTRPRPESAPSHQTLDRDKLDSQITTGFELVTINDDGTDGRAVPVKSAETILGRDGDTRFPTDEFLNPKHARLTVEDGRFYINDLRSLNGTFLKLRGEVRLRPGDTFLMGRQVLRFEEIEQDFDSKKSAPDGTRYMGSPAPGGDYKILQIGVGNIVQNIYCLPDSGVVLGREKGDIVFKDDKFMSGRHARIFTDDKPHLADLNSSNGTWIKLWDRTELKQDDYIFMGQQLFRIELPD